jgi:hypothetical protein
MSFLQKAREAASNAADQARQAAEQARLKATDPTTQERLRVGMQQAGESARQAGSAAKRGLVNMVDPARLADLVIKATALQERANAALREKGSPYRIAEVQITATFPPQIGFSIARIGDNEEHLTGREVDSSQLLQEVLAEEAGVTEGSGPMPDDGLGVDLGAEHEALITEDPAILP